MFPFAAASSRPAPPRPAHEAASFEGAAALREAGERVLVALVKGLQAMAGQVTLIEGALTHLRTVPVRDHLATCRPECVAAAVSCAVPACSMLAVLDATLVHALVELLAGGTGAEPLPSVPRPATGIDGQYAGLLVALAASAIETEWAAAGFASVRATRLEGAVPADLLGTRFGHVGVLTFELAIFGLRGTATLALPPAALDPFARLAVAVEDDLSAVAPDPAWNAVLRRELGRAFVRVDALLEASALSLGAVASLKPGQLIAVAPAARSCVALVSDGRTIFRGELGQTDDERYCLRVDDIVADAADAISDIRSSPDRRRSDIAKVASMEQPTGTIPISRDGASPHLDSIMRIPVSVQVFLGSASMPIADLMKLEQGSVVTLDHSVSDPVDVVVNGRVIARGELIALDDDPTKIGVKLIEIVGNPTISG